MTKPKPRTVPSTQRPPDSGPARAFGILTGGCVALAFFLQSVLGSDLTAGFFFSTKTWLAVSEWLGGQIEQDAASGTVFCQIPFLSLLLLVAGISTLSIGVLTAVVCWQAADSPPGSSARKRIVETIGTAWRWWYPPAIWELARIGVLIGGSASLTAVMSGSTHHVLAISLAGWLAELLTVRRSTGHRVAGPASSNHVAGGGSVRDTAGRRARQCVLVAGLLYVVVFTVMNWQLYAGLLVPHGDTVMYEEHLWNITHGKGFRSYLDQGLFLGEHIQVVHLLLLPLYVIWPSHLLLELAESLALASTALPVFWITRRATGSSRCGVLLGVACLLYAPLQFLDIAIDLKTFRPIAFGIPAVLFALDQFERGRWKTGLGLCVLALSAKEDYTLILGPLGIWIAAQSFVPERFRSTQFVPILARRRQSLRLGMSMAFLSGVWLLLATRILIPWFRDGAEVHYTRYFAKFGASPGEILLNMLTDPSLLLGELVTVSSVLYLLALFLPLGLLPLLSPTRLLVTAPVLLLLCLNEIVKGDPLPHHHFHAPAIPILFWAAAHGLAALTRADWRLIRHLNATASWLRGRTSTQLSMTAIPLRDATCPDAATGMVPTGPVTTGPVTTGAVIAAPVFGATFVWGLCLLTSVTDSLSPLSIRFHDPGTQFYWRSLYVPGERAAMFPRVIEQIPTTARVASTDFVHPRFTHFERSYDYSDYRRRVSDYEDRVPHDTDFIVIDTRHRYSNVHRPDDVRELRKEPENWELLQNDTDGCFIVLKRRESSQSQ